VKATDSNAVQLLLPANFSASQNGVVSIPVWLNNETNKQISSFSFAVQFDPNVLQPEQSAIETNNTLIGNGFMVVSDQARAGRLGIAAVSSNNFAGNSGTLVYLRFRVIGAKSVSTSALTVETDSQFAGTFEDNFGNKVPSTAINGSLMLRNTKQ
jgi:hypothetical protein